MKANQKKQTLSALDLVEKQLKSTFISTEKVRHVIGVKSTVDAAMVCGECTEGGGGSSGQCR